MSKSNTGTNENSENPAKSASFKRLPVWEFICIIAGLMALNATAVDIMLPALGDIQNTFQFEDDNQRQKMVIVYLMGMGLSQIFYGPLIDRFGRKPILAISLIVYVLASIACLLAPEYSLLIFARAIQGAAAGATRVVAAAVTRDCYTGRAMAEIMSVVMLIFMAAPILAPSIGEGILYLFGDWRSIFWALVILGSAMLIWSWIRLPETLAPEDKRLLQPKVIFASYKTVVTNRLAIGYSMASALIFGTLFGYISASEQIYSETFDKAATFALWFAGVSAGMAVSNLLNSRLVKKLGMRFLSHWALIFMVSVNVLHAIISHSGNESFAVFYVLMIASFICIGFIGPNFSATAMEPLGHIAGTASALYGFATTFLAAVIGGFIADHYDGTLGPLFVANAVCLLLALGIILITERGRLFKRGEV